MMDDDTRDSSRENRYILFPRACSFHMRRRKRGKQGQAHVILGWHAEPLIQMACQDGRS